MNLREAIDLHEQVRNQGHLGRHYPGDLDLALEELLAAAKRDLKRREKTGISCRNCGREMTAIELEASNTSKVTCPCGKSSVGRSEKPKRASLQVTENRIRDLLVRAVPLIENDTDRFIGGCACETAADILKALRETVVPWLRDWVALIKSKGGFWGRNEMKAEQMLSALGEEP